MVKSDELHDFFGVSHGITVISMARRAKKRTSRVDERKVEGGGKGRGFEGFLIGGLEQFLMVNNG